MIALYAKGQSTTRKSTVLETYFGYVPIMMGSVTIPMGQILSPVNPTSGASMGRSFSLSSFICWTSYDGPDSMVNVLPSLGRWIVNVYNRHVDSCLQSSMSFLLLGGGSSRDSMASSAFMFFWVSYMSLDYFFGRASLLKRCTYALSDSPSICLTIEQVSGKVSPSLIANEVVDECPAQLDEQAD
uniref:Uncharacterized protein n=1 Tax=Fagus sylvatica TaxID=28930 RepID=A0A2N9F3I5_FAGSY